MFRKALQDWTLSDGTFIPAGTFFGIASGPMNRDEVRVLFFPIANAGMTPC